MSGRGKSQRALELIGAAYTILSEIQPASIRAVCYQLFNRKLLLSMTKSETNRVSTQLRDAREAGTLPWSWIVDETRKAEVISAWKDPAAFIETVKRAYRRDRWQQQPIRVEVWSEKGTIRGTLAPVLQDYGVTFRVMHGYGSATAVYDAASESVSDDRPFVVLYVGDWDPSGLHMSEVDLPRRLERYGGNVEIHRIALTADHCDQLGERPAFQADEKRNDPRFAWYRRHFGRLCWELDALNPVDLRDAVEQAIHSRLDLGAWQQADSAERAERESLTTILSAWPGISGQASKCEREDGA